LQGIRKDRPDGSIPQPGEYGKGSDGHWLCCPPGKPELIGGLNKHQVIEHEDGTITVSPSIEIKSWDGAYYHGWLERGVWRD
jgi:hypothetical protein